MAQVLGIKKVKSSTPVSSQPAKKRKAQQLSQNYDEGGYDEEEDELVARTRQDELAGIDSSKPKRARKKKGEEPEEKRLKRFRVKPPVSYLERLSRAKQQRMFLIDRNRTTSIDGTYEEEVFDIAGTTGNIYQVTVSKIPSCTCPDANKGNQCKHIVYVMVNVLKAREDLAYQLALLSTELAEIFANAPVTPQSSGDVAAATLTTDTGGSRKPVEGDCPICVMEFEEGEDIVWCKAACGNNVHRHCFEQWQRSKLGPVKCVYCRSAWKGDKKNVKNISKSGVVGSEGYVNVGGELGLSGQRDMSSYHPHWVAQQQDYGRYY